MYATVVTGLFQPGKLDEGVQHFRDIVVPQIKDYPGFKSALLLADPGTGKTLAITLWETEAGMKATEPGIQESAAQLVQSLAGPPTQEGYEVSVQA